MAGLGWGGAGVAEEEEWRECEIIKREEKERGRETN
jgi:hypothetical protein